MRCGLDHARFAKRSFRNSDCAIRCAVSVDGPGSDRDVKGKYRARSKYGLSEVGMAKVIEYYVPKNFQSPQKWTPQQLGKVIEFRSEAKKSA